MAQLILQCGQQPFFNRHRLANRRNENLVSLIPPNWRWPSPASFCLVPYSCQETVLSADAVDISVVPIFPLPSSSITVSATPFVPACVFPLDGCRGSQLNNACALFLVPAFERLPSKHVPYFSRHSHLFYICWYYRHLLC